ncbi:MAG: hypothetical protein JO262_17335 [Solirubrobacterales bacterium]|nr:hypothetical protein [Solirubrobacterales bacterium]MBV9943895.1 hypothetical protein [Solirubrobacterales bacterium]
MSTTQLNQKLIQVTRYRLVNAFLRFPLAATATTDKSKDLESAQKLRALGPSVLVVGRGGPVRNPAQATDEAIAGAGG